jgi:Flp pilus assembly protein protease CpaA
MISAPTEVEWYAIYAPMCVALIVACAIELRTGLIPNKLSLPLLCYLLVARILIGPLPIGLYLLSLLWAVSLAIGFGWFKGFLGAGVAKLAVALSMGLPPAISIAVIVTLIAVSMILAWYAEERRDHAVIPGSPVLTAVFAAVLLVVTFCDVQQITLSLGG